MPRPTKNTEKATMGSRSMNRRTHPLGCVAYRNCTVVIADDTATKGKDNVAAFDACFEKPTTYTFKFSPRFGCFTLRYGQYVGCNSLG